MKTEVTDSIVYIVDDDEAVRNGFSRLLHSVGYPVKTYASANEFLKDSRPNCPGCVVLDVQMPELTGLDLQQELKKADFNLPIVFVTGHGDVPMSVQAMREGAVNFLSKPVDGEDLLAAIREGLEISQGKQASDEESAAVRNLAATLTPREKQVMEHVIAGLLNKQIAGELGISEKTVKVHRGRVMKKMDVESVAALVVLAQKAGIAPAK
jgi:RNA polymerase sigma factor (sigma-70 family)